MLGWGTCPVAHCGGSMKKTDYSSECRTGELRRGTVNHRQIFTVDRADRELQKRAQTWSKKCRARVVMGA